MADIIRYAKGIPTGLCFFGFAVFFVLGLMVGFVLHWYFWAGGGQ